MKKNKKLSKYIIKKTIVVIIKLIISIRNRIEVPYVSAIS